MVADRPLDVLDPNERVPRSAADVVAMAIVAQANVAQLRTAEVRLRGVDPTEHEIRTVSPGRVRTFREALVDFRRIRSYSGPELHLRLHEVWGQHCVFCWTLNVADPQRPPELASLGRDPELRCQTALDLKTAEIEAFFWRMQFEQRLRHEVGFQEGTRFEAARAAAKRVPAVVFGVPVSDCDDHALLVASCENAGMLAAIRWIADHRWAWGQAGIMDIDEDWIVAEAR